MCFAIHIERNDVSHGCVDNDVHESRMKLGQLFLLFVVLVDSEMSEFEEKEESNRS